MIDLVSMLYRLSDEGYAVLTETQRAAYPKYFKRIRGHNPTDYVELVHPVRELAALAATVCGGKS